MNRVAEIRRARVSGRMDNHERVVGTDWVVSIGQQTFQASIQADRDGATVTLDGSDYRITSGWRPGQPLVHLTVDGTPLVMKVARQPGGYRLRLRGADLKVRVHSPRMAELAALMLEKLPPDTSKMLLCPMPGMVMSIAVEEGQEVFESQPLATIEAMKMENILRAERKSVVTKINAVAGDSLAVDDVIMEFEA